MKKVFLCILVMVVCFLLACGKKVEVHEVTGTVKDATMNTILIATDRGVKYSFVKTDVPHTGLDGLLIGDVFTVYYEGELDDTRMGQTVKVIELKKISDYKVELAKEFNQKWGTVFKPGDLFHDYYVDAYERMKWMSREEEVGQLILARCPEENALEDIKNYHLGGYILFKKDFDEKTKNDVVTTIEAYQANAPIPMIFGVDEEGGTVVRISSNENLVAKPFASPQEIFQTEGMDGIILDAQNKASLLKSLGIHINFAPVADVCTSETAYMYPRTFGKSATETANYVTTIIEETKKMGVSSVLKHFPGYGNNADTHEGVAVDKRPYTTFQTSDFVPFKAGIDKGADFVLVSHNIVEAMDTASPASLSKNVHNTLRNELEFSGVIITDDLAMNAITTYTSGNHPAVSAILAGNDMMITTDYKEAYNKVLDAINSGGIDIELVDAAVIRVLAYKYSMGLLK